MLTNGDDLMQRLELFAQCDLPGGRDAVWTTAVFRFQRLNPAAPLQAGKGGIERAWFEPGAAELENIFHHGIAVLGAVGQAGKDQQ